MSKNKKNLTGADLVVDTLINENVEYILDMLNAVKNILNCSRCIGNTLPKKYKNRIDSHNAPRNY